MEETTVTTGTTSDLDALLDAGFEEDAAATVVETAAEQGAVVSGLQLLVPTDSLAARVALLASAIDDTPSMADIITVALAAYDRALDTVERLTASEPVSVLAGATWLNGGVHHGFMPIAEAPRFDRGMEVRLRGMTAWFDRYIELLSAVATLAEELAAKNKTVYGVLPLITDGFDNNSKHTISELARVIAGYRRMRTIIPVVIYAGHMPEPGTPDYMEELGITRRVIARMDIDDPELHGPDVTLEQLVRHVFTTAGFDPAMVFTPGQDMTALVQAFVSASKLMASVSQGNLPDGLTDVDTV